MNAADVDTAQLDINPDINARINADINADVVAVWETIDHARMIGDDATAETLLAGLR